MSLKLSLLAIFRELFVSHHRSLEFRAKIFAAMLVAKKTTNKDDFEILETIATQIYPDDAKRVAVLIHTTKEYVNKVKVAEILSIDDLLQEIDDELKEVKRYARKIDFSHLRRLMLESDEEDMLVQQRVYEYFLDEVKRYR